MKEDIYLIITKYLSSQASPEEIDRLLAWIEENEANKHTFDQLKRIWEHQTTEVKDREALSELHKLNALIDAREGKVPQRTAARKKRLISPQLLKIAAGIAIFMLFLAGGTWSYRFLSRTLKTNEVVETPAGEKRQVLLPDSSVVYLNSNSSIRYPREFSSEERHVFIEGEAFLEVTHHKNRPFVVHARNVSTKVLGTKFNVYSPRDESELRISLVEGKVAVSNDRNPDSPIVLLPDEEVVIDTKTEVAVKQNFDKNSTVAWTSGTLVFNNIPLSEAARKISAWYGIEVVFRNEALKDCRFRGKFHNEPLESVLQTMQRTGVIDYEITDDNKLYLNGKGCADPERDPVR